MPADIIMVHTNIHFQLQLLLRDHFMLVGTLKMSERQKMIIQIW